MAPSRSIPGGARRTAFDENDEKSGPPKRTSRDTRGHLIRYARDSVITICAIKAAIGRVADNSPGQWSGEHRCGGNRTLAGIVSIRRLDRMEPKEHEQTWSSSSLSRSASTP
jgi:hypothetical protein